MFISVSWMMSSSNPAAASKSNPDPPDDHSPLWQFVEKLEKLGGGGGNSEFLCKYCKLKFKGSYSRVKAHLLKIGGQGIQKCKKITSKQSLELERVVSEAQKRLQRTLPREVPLPPNAFPSKYGASSSNTTVHVIHEPKKRKGDSALEKAFNLGAREELHSEIARMFYSAGLPFHLARNPHYVRAFTFAASNNISGYIPPGYNMLRTTLLQKERAHIEKLVEPIKSAWKDKGVSIASDGWTDAQRRPIINFMAVSESGPMFLKAINCQGEYKDRFFIANLIRETILEVGPTNVVQVITDNAPVCKSAGGIIEGQFPHIFWTPCVVHTLNLALKNICAPRQTEANEATYEECHLITEIGGDCALIRNFIMNHSMRLSMFNNHVSLKLLTVADTRFASTIVMIKRLKRIKSGLLNLVVSEEWASYREDDVGKAAFVKEKVVSDLWWDKVDYILLFTEPICDMLRKADTDAPCLHLIYDMWDSMIEKVKTIIYRKEGKDDNEESTFYSVVYAILIDRWTKSNTPLHCLAHSLNPRYYSQEWLNAGPNRVAPHKDQEISKERERCFERYFANPMERKKAKEEYAKFSGAFKEFSSADCLGDRGSMEPAYWWVIYGSSTPFLQTLALRLLGQPSSSSCCERNWSIYSFIHSLKRNQITPQRAEDLVYVHSNLRLLSRKSKHYEEGESKMWDVGGDVFDSLEGSRILEVASLSLDEPDMESVLFTEEGIMDENDDEDDAS